MPTPAQNIRPWSTEQRFDRIIQALIEYPEMRTGELGYLVMAQSALETNLFRSDLLLRADNAFGMRIAHQRPQNNIGEDNGYAVYNSVEDSVADYIARQRAFGITNATTIDQYIAATVDSGYATAPHYAQAWRALYDEMFASDPQTAWHLTDEAGPVVVQAGGGGGIGLLLLLLLAATQLK